jgi:outer membrane receptor protein involved in Fe transport
MKHTLIILFTATLLYPQIEGIIVDAETGDPIPGVNIMSGETGAVSDNRGRFIIHAEKDSRVIFSHVAYEKIRSKAPESFWKVRMVTKVLQGSEVVVTAGLKDEQLQRSTSSVTVIDNRQISNADGSHFQDVMHDVSNLNWAGGTSRPRYFQIRGIGERSHYFAEGPPNFSVGFVIDDIDLSGMGMAGLLYDLEQIEVFKGPQSSVFGPNAMAGLISMKSTDPQKNFQGAVSLTGGMYATKRIGGMINIPMTDRIALRAVYHTNYEDGYRTNVFLQRTDTNKREEAVLREKLFIEANEYLNFTLTRVNTFMDNNFDAWAPDNNEELTTYTNDQGQDNQKTSAFSLRSQYNKNDLNTTLIYSRSKTDMVHSYDGDWANNYYWEQAPHNFNPNLQGWNYEFFDEMNRFRTSNTTEARIQYKKFILGLYLKELKETDEASGWLYGGNAIAASSEFIIDIKAVYSQYEVWINDKLKIMGNVRFEENHLNYTGTSYGYDYYYELVELDPVAIKVNHNFIGAKGVVQYLINNETNIYSSVSQGYKAGGINQHPYLAEENRPYDPENILNFELGIRSYKKNSFVRLTAFHALRNNQQVSISSQQLAGDPNSFMFYTDNATSGTLSGLELEGKYRINTQLNVSASLGMIDSKVNAFYFSMDPSNNTKQGDREPAHAPKYSYSLNINYRNKYGLFAHINFSAKDEFYFSDSHNEISEPYQLLNGHIGLDFGNWSVRAWGKNILDVRYATRGFYFGLEPIWNEEFQYHEYPDKKYVSFGDPANFGVSVDYSF